MAKALEEHAAHFDIRDPDFNDPDLIYSVYDEMRASSPIVRTDRPDFGGRSEQSWVVVGYEEAYQILRDWRHISSDARTVAPDADDLMSLFASMTVIGMDPPVQQELRRILNPCFAPDRITPLEDATRASVNRLIDEFIEDGSGDIATVAWQMPGEVLFREVLGIPVELVGECLHWQSISMLSVEQDVRVEATQKVMEIVAGVLAGREGQPPRGDVIDAMLGAEIDGRPIKLEEVVANGVLLVAAGLETTSNAMTVALHWLAKHPEERDKLVANPDLMPDAVEEFLRYGGSVHSLLRYVGQDTEVCGHAFKAGDVIQIGYAAANRDPREFPEPDQCILDRKNNRHLTFGVGAHRCLGSNLARMELRVGLEEVLRRMPDYRISDDEACKFIGTFVTRGYHTIPVEFTPGRRELS